MKIYFPFLALTLYSPAALADARYRIIRTLPEEWRATIKSRHRKECEDEARGSPGGRPGEVISPIGGPQELRMGSLTRWAGFAHTANRPRAHFSLPQVLECLSAHTVAFDSQVKLVAQSLTDPKARSNRVWCAGAP